MIRFTLAWRVLAACAAAGLTPGIGRAQENGLLREVYTGIEGSAVADLLFSPSYPDDPSFTEVLPDFEAPIDVDDFYGQRVRGYVLPPQSGNYTFWISSDDASVLYLSGDDNPATKSEIASVSGWTNSREWDREPSQQSAPIFLQGGQRYYIEALMKEHQGGDNLAVQWQLPNNAVESPIPGSRLEVFGLGPPQIVQQPASVSVLEGEEAVFSVRLELGVGADYQWQRDTVDIPGANAFDYVVESAQAGDDGAQFRCVIINSYGSVTSATATLNVLADTTPPGLASVFNLGSPNRITVLFTEPVDPATALVPGNYLLTGGASVSAVRFVGDEATVVLETSTLQQGVSYTLLVRNVRDQASVPNTIPLGTSAAVSLDFNPLATDWVYGASEPLGPSRRRSGLVISEIMYNPPVRTDGRETEYIEIYNADQVAIDLGGYRLSGEVDYTIPSGVDLEAGEFLVVAPVPADVQAAYGISGVRGGFDDRLGNGGGTLRLHNRLGAVLWETEYDDDPPWPVAADNGGHSLVLARPSYGEDDPRAWSASRLVGGSPGAADIDSFSAFDTIVINEILSHTDEPLLDTIELYNYSNNSLSLGGCILTDDPAEDRYVIPSGVQIPAKGYLVLDQSQLGFAFSAAGETVYLKTPGGTSVIDAVRFGPQALGVSWGRSPDAADNFVELASLSPGSANPPELRRDIVIHELMYHPPSGDDADEFLELFHTGTAAADLSGWRLSSGIEFFFPAGTTLPPGGYLVVAKDRARLLANHPGLDPSVVVGDYDGVLSNSGETVLLQMPEDLVDIEGGAPVTNTVYITVDEVTYRDGGQWGVWSDGGGSSLELTDPLADNRLAANWADSDESDKAMWATVEHTGVLDLGLGAINEVHILLLGDGECLIDNVEVSTEGGPNQVPNGAFESNLDQWVIQGNHVHSGWSEPGQGDGSSRALHLRATGGGDNGANRVESDLSTSLSAGNTATIRARARWLRGHPDLLVRLHGNHLEAAGTLPIPTNLGTPGAPNSRALLNAAPAIQQVSHFPVLPAAGQPVTVVARVDDPDGLANLVVRYRLDPNPEIQTAAMAYRGAGRFAATLPGRPTGTLLAFYIEAIDASDAAQSSTYPPNPAGRECLIRFGEPTPTGDLGVYRMWMTRQHIQTWTAREKMSNEPLDGTFVLGNSRVVYNAGARYRGSPFIRPGYNSPDGNLCAYVWTFPKDQPVLGADEFNLDTLEPGRDDTRQRERTSFWIAEQLGVPFSYQRYVRVVFNGIQRGDVYTDSQQANGDYMQTWFPDDDRGEIYKIDDWFEFSDAVTMEFNVNARLEDYTTTGGMKKQARYRWSWERKANRGLDDDYSELFALVDAVNTPDPVEYVHAVEALVDVEQWMRVFAVRRVVADWDGYSYSRGKNQFAYKPEQDRWKMVLWDLDFSLGGGSRSATQDLFDEVDDPTIQRMFSTVELVRPYLRALYDAANGPLQSANVGPVLTAQYQALQSNGVSAANPSSISSWINDRRNFILSWMAGGTPPAVVLAITSNDGANFSTDVNLVTLTGTAPIQVRDILVNGTPYPVTWTSVLEWELQIALGPGSNQLNLGALGSNGSLLSGLFDNINITYTGLVEDPAEFLVINEIMYNPAVPGAEFVEIHNRSSSTAFNLTGYRLEGVDFDFPAGTVIPPGAYLVIVQDLQRYLAAYGAAAAASVVGVMDGRLDNGGETLRLIRVGATPAEDVTIDAVTYDDDPPWPAPADGFGPSLQLTDPAQDNNRIANWAALEGTGSGSVTNLVVDFADVWKYHDLAQNLGDDWRQSDYPDGSWQAGPGLLAWEDGPLPEPIGTALTLGARTFYFRHAFNFQGDPGATELWLETILDDGAVFYLNGIEVFRLGVNAPSPTYFTFASRAIDNATLEGPFAIPAGALQMGENVLAVEVHQINAGSSDVVFGARLTAVTAAGLAYTPGFANSVPDALPPLPNLWLNEVQPGNQSGPTDGSGDHDPWVELYNAGSTAIDLSEYFLSPDYGTTNRWPFPAGATLGAGEFRVVWLDAEPAQSSGSEYHADFAIPRFNGSISLIQDLGEGLLIDYLNYGTILDDRSYGAWPDGTPAHRATFYYATPGAPNREDYPIAPITINEWMSANSGAALDPADGNPDDWFELYNAGPTPVDLSGYTLTDNLSNPDQWVIPAGTVIAGGGFLVVWADDETNQNQPGVSDLHAAFKLSRDGEAIGLFAPNGDPIDSLTFEAQDDNQSHGRWPDGNSSILELNPPTPGAPNLTDGQTNSPPSVGPVADRVVEELTELRITIPASDPNPGQELTFALAPGAPAGATLNPESGLLVWTPTEAQGPGVYPVTVTVTDDGSPPLDDSTDFTITVQELNHEPNLFALPDRQAYEGSPLQFQAVATDPDLPAQSLTFSLLEGAPAAADIDPDTGIFSWTPGFGDVPGPHSITIVVTDDGSPPLNSAGTFSISVADADVVRFLSIEYLGAQTLRLDWFRNPDAPNALEASDNLINPAWMLLSPDSIPPIDIDLSSHPHRAFRVTTPSP